MRYADYDTDLRYCEDIDPQAGVDWTFSGRWPDVPNIFERRVASNLRPRSNLRLDLDAFVRVIGLASQLHNRTITLNVEVLGARVCATVVDLQQHVMPPITADDAGALASAIDWYAVRCLRFRLTVQPDHGFWFPLD